MEIVDDLKLFIKNNKETNFIIDYIHNNNSINL